MVNSGNRNPILVETVAGPLDLDSMEYFLPHEHLFLDLRNQACDFADPERKRIAMQKVGAENLKLLEANPYSVRDNLVLDDLDTAAEELSNVGCPPEKLLVSDCTSIGISRQPEKLRQLSLKTGVNIIAGCGYYTQDTHPLKIRDMTAAEIAEEMIRDCTEGIDGTGVKAGVIGEIGTSSPIHPDEKKVLRASAETSNRTGLPIQVHTYPWAKCGLEAARLLLDCKADPGRIIICHTDVLLDSAYIMELLRMDVFVEFDNFGKEYKIDVKDGEPSFSGGPFSTDLEKVMCIRRLVDKDLHRHVLLTNDICLKNMLRKFGGKGYGHVFNGVRRMMLERGIAGEAVDMMLFRNPKKPYSK